MASVNVKIVTHEGTIYSTYTTTWDPTVIQADLNNKELTVVKIGNAIINRSSVKSVINASNTTTTSDPSTGQVVNNETPPAV